MRASEQRRRVRCAIYTRKSSEEGLEQDFNSLHAQREACQAYVLSQRHAGGQLIDTAYDDGGFSGGSLERPALQRLTADIAAGRIEVVVVYKVDRLTRSLADFAKIVELFDAHRVSFVSVTQQFNTTSSMGRLTLNVLLSFAQFERDITGERIRDKIAASKKKGMWMGGFVPFGYEANERRLVTNPEEAQTIRRIFDLYLELGCVHAAKKKAEELGLVSKCRVSQGGRASGGRPLSRGYIYRLLSNPLYIGEIAHGDHRYPGQHDALVHRATWDAVQARLKGNVHRHRVGLRAKEPSLLAGLLFDANGEPLTPSHAAKGTRRYRYYISRSLVTEAGSSGVEGWRIPAQDAEVVVLRGLRQLLADRLALFHRLEVNGTAPGRLQAGLARATELVASIAEGDLATQRELLLAIIDRVVITEADLGIAIRIDALRAKLSLEAVENSEHAITVLKIPVLLKRRGTEAKLVMHGQGKEAPQPDPALIKALARGHAWFAELAQGRAASINEIARRESVTGRYVSRLIQFAFLAPDIAEAILAGRQPLDLTTETINREIDLPLDWCEQRALLGF
jgi:DNA invertase Pin-like site-specific DNA recombinase